MIILLIEDDSAQADITAKNISKEITDAQTRRIRTERQFVEEFETIAASPPDLIVIDLILPWALPEPDIPPAPGTPYEAGYRCLDRLHRDSRTRNIPVLMYTVLEEEVVRKQPPERLSKTVYLHKDLEARPLAEAIRRLTSRIA